MSRVSNRRQEARQGPYYEAYVNIIETTQFPWCWCCGVDRVGLDRAHLSSGSGCMRREEDRRAVVLLCRTCHLRHQRGTGGVRIAGQTFRPIGDSHVLFIKRHRDPSFWDLDYLKSVWRGPFPEIVCDREVESIYQSRRGKWWE